MTFASQACHPSRCHTSFRKDAVKICIRRAPGRRKFPTCTVPRAASQGAEVAAASELLEAIKSTSRGLDTSSDARQRIDKAISRLEELPSSGSQSGTWKLVWTTEQETLFILKNAGWFRTQAGDVYQVIDEWEGYLQNVITFPPEGAFIVDSAIQIDPTKRARTNFQFTSATLKLPSRPLQLPPFGKGWFDNVYMDEQIRVSKDIRGDTLVTVRDGPPRRFM